MRIRLAISNILWSLVLVACFSAHAEDALNRDIHEEVLLLKVSAHDLNGVETEGEITITTFRPDGDGPFPLVVLSHGRDTKTRAQTGRIRFESAARYFVRKGFAVAVPTRLGYGPTAALGDPETNGSKCSSARYEAALEASSSQIAATVKRLRQEPWIAPDRLLLVGQSVGGISTVAATALKIPGLIAAVNFAGGHGGSPDTHPGVPCNPPALEKLYGKFGKTASAPMLWVYTENDLYFNPQHSQAWHTAFTAAGGRAEYRLLPAFGTNGHLLFSTGNNLWQLMLDDWLTQFGFPRPGTLQRPAPSSFAALDDAGRVPFINATARAEGYEKFLAANPPRAFAVSEKGNWGFATGEDDLLSRTLAFCQRKSGNPCKLYAVDNDVVWHP